MGFLYFVRREIKTKKSLEMTAYMGIFSTSTTEKREREPCFKICYSNKNLRCLSKMLVAPPLFIVLFNSNKMVFDVPN